MRSWQGHSCKKKLFELNEELRIAEVHGHGGRVAQEIEAEIALWKARLAGPEPQKEPAVTDAPSCLECTRKLRPSFKMVSRTVHTIEGHYTVDEPGELIGFGYNATGHFCSLRCGWMFAEKTLRAEKTP